MAGQHTCDMAYKCGNFQKGDDFRVSGIVGKVLGEAQPRGFATEVVGGGRGYLGNAIWELFGKWRARQPFRGAQAGPSVTCPKF